eukprot:2149274-Karenia_brevis.AAC.1
MLPTIRELRLFGPNQFAYTQDHSARDALLYLITSWLIAFARGRRIGLYCSDVSGAFDNVSRELLLRKISQKFNGNLENVLSSWLDQRFANVVVGGKMSRTIVMSDMVFQGTAMNFEPITYADDLNAFTELVRDIEDDSAINFLKLAQQRLHLWGDQNFAKFDASKESLHIFSRQRPVGGSTRILGIIMDPKLIMDSCVHETVVSCNWKCRNLLRVRAYYSVREMDTMFNTCVQLRFNTVGPGTKSIFTSAWHIS